LKCEQQTLQCSLLVEKHRSNSNLKNEDEEAIRVGFMGCFLSKIGFKEAIGDALRIKLLYFLLKKIIIIIIII